MELLTERMEEGRGLECDLAANLESGVLNGLHERGLDFIGSRNQKATGDALHASYFSFK